MRATATTDFVTVSFDGEDAAQLCMVATKGELQRARERMRNGRPQRNLVGCHVLSIPSELNVLIGNRAPTVSRPTPACD